MTQNEIIEMAREVGLCRTQSNFDDWIDAGPSGLELEDFAKLVEDKVRQEIAEKNAPVIKKVNEHIQELQDAVKAEREACAKVCEGNWTGVKYFSDFAALIRARGES
jgi:hypothetical protein